MSSSSSSTPFYARFTQGKQAALSAMSALWEGLGPTPVRQFRAQLKEEMGEERALETYRQTQRNGHSLQEDLHPSLPFSMQGISGSAGGDTAGDSAAAGEDGGAGGRHAARRHPVSLVYSSNSGTKSAGGFFGGSHNEDDVDETPMHCAAESGFVHIVALFLERGGNPNAPDGRNRTALHAACSHPGLEERRYQVLSQLLEWQGAMIIEGEEPERVLLNHVDDDGNAAIHFAAAHGHERCVDLLVQKGALISIVNKEQMTPCELAHANHHSALADKLEMALVRDAEFATDGGRGVGAGGAAADAEATGANQTGGTHPTAVTGSATTMAPAADAGSQEQSQTHRDAAFAAALAAAQDDEAASAVLAQQQQQQRQQQQQPHLDDTSADTPGAYTLVCRTVAADAVDELIENAIADTQQVLGNVSREVAEALLVAHDWNAQAITTSLASAASDEDPLLAMYRAAHILNEEDRNGGEGQVKDKITPKDARDASCLVCEEVIDAMHDTPPSVDELNDVARVHGLRFPCGHAFCIDCVCTNLSIEVRERGLGSIQCPAQDCGHRLCPNQWARTLLGGDAAETTAAFEQEGMLDKFWRHRRRNVVDVHPHLRPCPQAGCGLVLHLQTPQILTMEGVTEDSGFTACCELGHSFCWSCNQPAHAPCTCTLWTKWLKRVGMARNVVGGGGGGKDGSGGSGGGAVDVANALWLSANTKKCPRCKTPIEKNEGCNHMTCRKCRYEFCWVCMQDWSTHNASTGGFFQCNKFLAMQASKLGSDAASGGRGSEGKTDEDFDENESDLTKLQRALDEDDEEEQELQAREQAAQAAGMDDADAGRTRSSSDRRQEVRDALAVGLGSMFGDAPASAQTQARRARGIAPAGRDGSAQYEQERMHRRGARMGRFIHHYTKFSSHGESLQMERRLRRSSLLRFAQVVQEQTSLQAQSAQQLRCNSNAQAASAGNSEDAAATSTVIAEHTVTSALHRQQSGDDVGEAGEEAGEALLGNRSATTQATQVSRNSPQTPTKGRRSSPGSAGRGNGSASTTSFVSSLFGKAKQFVVASEERSGGRNSGQSRSRSRSPAGQRTQGHTLLDDSGYTGNRKDDGERERNRGARGGAQSEQRDTAEPTREEESMEVLHRCREAVEAAGLDFLQNGFDELIKCRNVLLGSYIYAFNEFASVDDGSSYDVEAFGGRRRHRHWSRRPRNHREEERMRIFTSLQAELEMLVEMLSDIVARRRLRASKQQVVDATIAARRKRLEFEGAVVRGTVPESIDRYAPRAMSGYDASVGGSGSGRRSRHRERSGEHRRSRRSDHRSRQQQQQQQQQQQVVDPALLAAMGFSPADAMAVAAAAAGDDGGGTIAGAGSAGGAARGSGGAVGGTEDVAMEELVQRLLLEDFQRRHQAEMQAQQPSFGGRDPSTSAPAPPSPGHVQEVSPAGTRLRAAMPPASSPAPLPESAAAPAPASGVPASSSATPTSVAAPTRTPATSGTAAPADPARMSEQDMLAQAIAMSLREAEQASTGAGAGVAAGTATSADTAGTSAGSPSPATGQQRSEQQDEDADLIAAILASAADLPQPPTAQQPSSAAAPETERAAPNPQPTVEITPSTTTTSANPPPAPTPAPVPAVSPVGSSCNSGERTDSAWNCSACTFLNTASAGACAICGTARRAKA